MKKMAKGLSLLLAIAMLSLVALSPLPAQKALAEGDVYEFTVWRAKNNYSMKYEFTGEDLISKYVMDKFGIKINYEGPTGDWRTAYSVMLASADMPECIRDLGTGSEYMQTIKLGYLLPLDGWIEQYDGYRSTYSQRQIDMMKVDGASYTLVNWGHYDGTISGGNAGWAVNDAIYESLGSPKLETMDDLYAYLTAVKEAELLANNQPVIPLQSSTQGTYVGILPLLYVAQGAGRSGNYISKLCYDDAEGKLNFVMEDEALLNALIYANKLYSEGLVNTDFFVETKDQITEKLMMGRAAVYADTALINVLGGTMSSLSSVDDESVHYTVIEPIVAEGVAQADVYTDAQSSL